MFGLGATELIVILAIVILLFGATRIPALGTGFRKMIGNFKSSSDLDEPIDVTPKKEKSENDRS